MGRQAARGAGDQDLAAGPRQDGLGQAEATDRWILANSEPRSGRDAGALPNLERCGLKFLEHRSLEEVTLVVEGVVGRRMDVEEALRRAG